MSDRVPYHELERTVARLETELAALGPMAEVILRADRRTEEANARAARAETRADECLAAVDKAYRRGYSTGYGVARRGRPAEPTRALSDPRSIVKAVA